MRSRLHSEIPFCQTFRKGMKLITVSRCGGSFFEAWVGKECGDAHRNDEDTNHLQNADDAEHDDAAERGHRW